MSLLLLFLTSAHQSYRLIQVTLFHISDEQSYKLVIERDQNELLIDYC